MFSFRIMRYLCKRRALRSPHKNFHFKTALLTVSPTVQKRSVEEPHNLDVLQVDILNALKILKNYSDPEAIKWEEIIKELTNKNAKDPKTTIMRTCEKLHNLDLGMRYIKYVLENHKDLTAHEVNTFCQFLSKFTDNLSQYEEVLKTLYERIRTDIFSSVGLQQLVLSVFVRIPNCFQDCVENLKERPGVLPIAYQAFRIGEPEIGWHFLKNSFLADTSQFLSAYVEYCIAKASEGKFSPKLITDLTEYCGEALCYLYSKNLTIDLKPLIEAVYLNKNDYILSLDECQVNQNNVCSSCGSKLKNVPVSNKEVKMLRKAFYEHVLNNRHVDIHSSKEEVGKFEKFLKNCEPFDIVLDGLNLIYRGKLTGVNSYFQYLNYFLENNWRVLVIARQHSKRKIRPTPVNKTKLKTRFQTFLTSNESNDDLFLMYSALHQGHKTYFCSGDFFSPYIAHMPADCQLLFRKWKISCQYVIHPRLNLLHPWPHLGVSQLTDGPTEDGEYIWHLSYCLGREPLSRTSPINWVCLKAKPRAC